MSPYPKRRMTAVINRGGVTKGLLSFLTLLLAYSVAEGERRIRVCWEIVVDRRLVHEGRVRTERGSQMSTHHSARSATLTRGRVHSGSRDHDIDQREVGIVRAAAQRKLGSCGLRVDLRGKGTVVCP